MTVCACTGNRPLFVVDAAAHPINRLATGWAAWQLVPFWGVTRETPGVIVCRCSCWCCKWAPKSYATYDIAVRTYVRMYINTNCHTNCLRLRQTLLRVTVILICIHIHICQPLRLPLRCLAYISTVAFALFFGSSGSWNCELLQFGALNCTIRHGLAMCEIDSWLFCSHFPPFLSRSLNHTHQLQNLVLGCIVLTLEITDYRPVALNCCAW